MSSMLGKGNTSTIRVRVLLPPSDSLVLIPCDPKRPCSWLLQVVNDQYNQQRTANDSQPREESEERLVIAELFNQSQNMILNPSLPIGSVISPEDTIQARAQDFNEQQSKPFSLRKNGLFYQQLEAFAFLGNAKSGLLPPSPASKLAEKKEGLMQLLLQYMNINQAGNVYKFKEESMNSKPIPPSPPELPEIARTRVPSKSVDSFAKPSTSPLKKSISNIFERNSVVELRKDKTSTSVSTILPGIGELRTVFEVIFKNQSLGMKLFTDPTKSYALVKECFASSEAQSNPEIVKGVVILSVNNEKVCGIGLSKTLNKLREAPRPVTVKFGVPANLVHS